MGTHQKTCLCQHHHLCTRRSSMLSLEVQDIVGAEEGAGSDDFPSVQTPLASSRCAMDQLISGTSLHCMDFKDVKMGKLIGEGAFGKVHRCVLRANKRTLAAKVIAIPASAEDRRLLHRELSVMSSVPTHQHIVQLVGVTVNKGNLLVLSELMEESLSDVLQRMYPAVLPIGRVLLYSRQLASALHHLHSQAPAVLHRDLKSHNILLSHGQQVCKLSDFGLSRRVVEEGVMTGETGSYRWMAPEVIRHEPYDKSCDVFSFALVLVELLTSMVPHPDKRPIEVLYQVADQALRPELPSHCDTELCSLIENCWHQQPQERWTSEQIVCKLEAMDIPVLPEQPVVIVGKQDSPRILKMSKARRNSSRVDA